MDKQSSMRLETEKVPRLLWEFSLPAIVGMLANSLYTIVDRLFVGNLVGAEAIAGMSVTMPISFVLLAFASLVGIGSAAMISIRLGEKKTEEANRILGNAFVLNLITSITLSGVLLFFLDRLLVHFGAGPGSLPYARQFISIILFGAVFQFTAFGLSSIIRAEGNPRTAMAIQLTNAGLNIVLVSIFVYGLGLGIRGAALATILAQAVSATWAFLYFRGNKSVLKLRLEFMPLRFRLVRSIFSIGMAPFFMQLVGSIINILFNQGLARYGGDAAIGAFGIINTLSMLFIMPVLGISQGAQPIVGYNYGAGKPERVLETLKRSIVASTLVVILGYAIVQAFPGPLLRAFTSDQELLRLGTRGMRILLLAMPVVGFQIIGATFFQSIGQAGKSLILALLRQALVLIPLLLILPSFMKLDGIWTAAPVSDLFSALITWVFLRAEIDRMKARAKKKEDAGYRVRQGSQ